MNTNTSISSAMFSFGMYSTPYKISYERKIYEFSPVYWYKDTLTLEKKLHFTIKINEESAIMEIIFWDEKYKFSKELFEKFKSEWIIPTISVVGHKYEIRVISLVEYLKHIDQLVKNS